MNSHQSDYAVENWPLGTQAASVCEVCVFTLVRLMTVDRLGRRMFVVSGESSKNFRLGDFQGRRVWLEN